MDSETYEIKLPLDVKNRRITVFAGNEVLAIREPGKDKFVHKIKRCNMCGLCCLMEIDEHGFGIQNMEIDGKIQSVCGALRKDGDKYECHAGPKAPYGCVFECSNPNFHPKCPIEYEKS